MSERLQTDLPERDDELGSDPRSDELGVAEQRQAEQEDREARAAGARSDDVLGDRSAESSYPTEREQGAAQPGPGSSSADHP